MQPTMKMDTSSKTLNTQASLNSKEIEDIIFIDYHYNEKTWSKWPTAPYTTIVAEEIIVSIMDHSHLYSCKRVDTSSFQVNFQNCAIVDCDVVTENVDNTDFRTALIPLFSRVYTIEVDRN